MKGLIAAVIPSIILLLITAAPAYAQNGGLGIDSTSTPKLPFTPTEEAIQTLQADADIQEYANRITAAMTGNNIMLDTITNNIEACLAKLLTADKVAIAACAEFVENQNKAFSTFLKDNQNLTGIILYGAS